MHLCVCVIPYLHQHNEAHKEGDEHHTKQEELPSVFTSEDSRVHVDYRRHKALNTHKLMEDVIWYFDTSCYHV